MNSNIKNLLVLIQENPELEIMPMVDAECIGGDDYSYYSAEWGKAEVDEYYTSDERIYFKSTDYEELVEKYCENEETKLTGNDLEIWAIFEVNNLKWIKAIVVHINSL